MAQNENKDLKTKFRALGARPENQATQERKNRSGKVFPFSFLGFTKCAGKCFLISRELSIGILIKSSLKLNIRQTNKNRMEKSSLKVNFKIFKQRFRRSSAVKITIRCESIFLYKQNLRIVGVGFPAEQLRLPI